MTFHHQALADGRWQKLTLAEQLGNIGSEVGRAARSFQKDDARFKGAVERALELFDLTLEDPRWTGRRREIARAREVFSDAISGGSQYRTSLQELEQYFMYFAILARNKI
jgi:hypothetical protein